MSNNKKKIIVIGGGAGGLELVAKLRDKLKHMDLADITLIDKQLKHIWKPLYHEVAAGTFTNYHEEIDYISYAYQKGFNFIPGTIKQINRENKWILLEPLFEENIKTAERQLQYDILLLATGSQVNDFNMPGVKEHCFFLDSLPEAELCNEALLKQVILSTQNNLAHINISIIGGGATGVELAAELNHALAEVKKYTKITGLRGYDSQITVIESGNRILGPLPERISRSVSHYLRSNKISISTNTKVTAIKENGFMTSEGNFIESSIVIWAAGIKGNTTTIKHDLEVNKIHQFIVRTTLQTTKDDDIFAFGDCASCPQTDKEGKSYTVPPRAQAAHQQASLLVKSILNYLQNKPLPAYRYRDYGSLISLSRHNLVGNLMNKVVTNLYIEGVFARLAYSSLYKKHLLILKGAKYVILSTLANLFMRKQRPEIKLH